MKTTKTTKTLIWALAFSLMTASLSVFADRGGRPNWKRHDDRGWHSDFRHFRGHDHDRWRGGHWEHGHHDGRLGWWWVVPTLGLWYWYTQPVYPYPNPYTPPVVVVPSTPAVPSAPPQAQYWYYCDASQTYYPYVQSCPGGWRMVPATPSGQ